MATARVLTDRERPVRILDATGNVDPPIITISKSAGESITWFAHPKHSATIRFDSADGSPFQRPTFSVQAGGHATSDDIRPEAEPKEYSYNVVSENGVNDPKVIIRP